MDDGRRAALKQDVSLDKQRKSRRHLAKSNLPTDPKIIEENGIDMYVDDFRNIQFKDCDPPTGCGKYDTFGRTKLFDGTDDYSVLSSSETNMLVSGK